MLSVSKIKAGDAAEYYGREDNYYFLGETSHQWLGKGAEALGLTNEVDGKTLNAILDGKLPDGTEMRHAGTNERRRGFDLTFSAPKSVSLLALVGGRKELIEMHNQAVKTAFNEIEMLASTRIKKNGEVDFVNTGNLVAATFNHDTSRNLDPQLHTHVLVANATQTEDGVWRALSSDRVEKTGFCDVLYDHNISFGKIYRHTLKNLLEQAGYETIPVHKNGMFELKDVPKEAIDLFSSRSQEIQEATEKGASPKSKDIAALATRAHKQNPDRIVLHERWKSDIRQTGWSIDDFLEQVDKKTETVNLQINEDTRSVIVNEAVLQAVENLGEERQHYSYFDLLHESLECANYQCSPYEIGENIQEAIDRKEVIPQNSDASLLTSRSTLLNKKAITSLASQIKTGNETVTYRPLIIKNSKFNVKENLIHDCIKENTAISLVSGNASISQKAEFLESLVDLQRSHGRDIQVFANNTRQKEQLDGETQARFAIGTRQNIMNALEERGEKALYRNSTVVVDGIENWSTKETYSLLQAIKQRNCQVILFDNQTRHSALKGSSSLQALKDSGITNLKWKPNGKETPVTVHSESDRITRLESMAHHWVKSFANGETVIAKLNGKNEQGQLEEIIRDKLKKTGHLKGEQRIVSVQKPVFIDNQNRMKISTYKEGDRLIHSSSNPYEKRHYTIIDKNPKSEDITLQDGDGNKKRVHLKTLNKNWSLYRQEKKEISIGEQMTALASDKSQNLKAGDTLTVKGFGNGNIIFSHKDKTVKLPDDGLKADYGYVTSLTKNTNHKDTTIASLKTSELNKQNLNAVRQSTEQVEIFTPASEKKASSMLGKLKGDSNQDAKGPDEVRQTSDIQKTLERSIEKAGAKQVSFTRAELLAASEGFSSDTATMVSAIQQEIDSGKLKEFTVGSDKRLVPEAAYNAERSIVEAIADGVDQFQPLVKGELTFPDYFTSGQREMASNILKTSDQFIAIQGYAGVGKTSSLRMVVDTLATSTKKTDIIGLAPTHQAVKEMRSVGIKGQTIKSFLVNNDRLRQEGQELNLKGKLIVLDEASMVGNKDMAETISKLYESGGRVVLIGDKAQLDSPEAGTPYSMVQERSAIRTVIMDEILRQDAERNLPGREAVYHSIDHEFDKALNKISQQSPSVVSRISQENMPASSVVEVKNNPKNKTEGNGEVDERSIHERIADDYMSRTKEARDNTAIIAHMNDDRKSINSMVHQKLIKTGDIGKDESSINQLVRVRDDNVDKYSALHYKNYKDSILRIDGKYFKIDHVNTSDETISLADTETGEKKTFSPKNNHTRDIAIYEQNPISLSVGDKVRLTQTDKSLGRVANDAFKVNRIDGKTIIIGNSKGEVIKLQPDRYMEDQHIDYDYARTSYGLQGASKLYSISLEGSYGKRKFMATPKSFYVAESRNKLHAQIYTDGTTDLVKRLKEWKKPKTAHDILHRDDDKAYERIKNITQCGRSLHDTDIKKQIEHLFPEEFKEKAWFIGATRKHEAKIVIPVKNRHGKNEGGIIVPLSKKDNGQIQPKISNVVKEGNSQSVDEAYKKLLSFANDQLVKNKDNGNKTEIENLDSIKDIIKNEKIDIKQIKREILNDGNEKIKENKEIASYIEKENKSIENSIKILERENMTRNDKVVSKQLDKELER